MAKDTVKKSAYSKFDDERSVAKSILPKIEGRLKIRRMLMILLYVAYIALWIVALAVFQTFAVYLAALSVVTLCILIFFTWRFAKIEYELVIHMGELKFATIYGGLTRGKELFSCHIRDLSVIAPYTGAAKEEADSCGASKTLIFVSDIDSADNYYVISETPDGEKTLVIFETEEKSRKMLKYYNSTAFRTNAD